MDNRPNSVNVFDRKEIEIICMYWELYEAHIISAERRDDAINSQVNDYRDKADDKEADDADALLDAMLDNII